MQTPSSKEPSARVAGRYLIEAEIATGGMGAVYRVVDQSTGRKIALKRLLPDAGKTAAILFEREYHTLSGLSHPRVIEVYDYGYDDAGPYYTMELMDGEDLRQLSPMPYELACSHLRDVASSLALLHARRFIHRDLSARNVRATGDGRCKLFDFGALATFGIAGEIVGTPPGIAPEAVTGLPLDHRVDIYGLGALAYYLLTRRHAYPARTVADLGEAWKTLPAPPSAYAQQPVPPALDDLVLSCLNQDPLARPSTIAEVIDRLNKIARLPPDNEISGVVDSYLSGGAMVGRDKPLTRLKRLVVRAMRNRGGVATIHHAPGMGGSRLLSELAIAARIAGATVLQVDAESHRSPHGVTRALIRRLLDEAPAQALEAAQRDMDILSWLYPPLAQRAGVTPFAVDGERNPGALRVRLQTALVDWFHTVAKDNVLVIAIDSAQRLDESSAAFVASLAQTCSAFPVFIVATVREGETAASAVAMRALHETGTQLRLRPLTVEETTTWMGSLFGEVPNTARVAAWLHQRSGGNPAHTQELARHLVNLEAVRYVDGTWVIPTELPTSELPLALGDLVVARVETLSEAARALLELLCVHRGNFSLQMCVALTLGGANEAFRAVDELVHNGLLVGSSQSYHFSQDQARQKLYANLPPERQRELHLRVANALQALGNELTDTLEAGWHFFHAGADEQGAELLGRAGLLLIFDADDLPAAVPALEAALASYKRLGRSRRELITLLTPLASAGFYVDRRLAVKYGDEALELMKEETGLARVARLSWLGPYLSLWFGLGASLLRYVFSPKLGFYAGYHQLMVSMLTVTTSLAGVATMCLDTKEAKRMAAVLEPFKFLGSAHPVTFTARFCGALTDITLDYPGRALSRLKAVFKQLSNPHSMRGVPKASQELIYGGVLQAMGAMESFRDGDGALQCADKLDAIGLRLYDMLAAQIRSMYHAQRGEIDEAEKYRRRVETHAIQHGSAWQAEVWAPASRVLSYAITGDVIGMKRTMEQLELLRDDIPSLDLYCKLARGEYALLRGDYPGAVETLGRVIEGSKPGDFIGRAAATAGLASAYRALGDPKRGRDLCVVVLADLSDADRSVVAHFLRPEVEIYLADAALGDVAGAARAIDALIEKHRAGEGPVTLGSLHRARAQVALLAGDQTAFSLHLAEMNRWFRPTRNPALIGQCERLASQASAFSGRPPSDLGELPSPDEALGHTGAGSILGQCFGPEERAQRALELVTTQARGTQGYLFAATPQGLQVIAPLHGDMPSTSLVQAVELDVRAFHESEESTALSKATSSKTASVNPDHGHNISLLTARIRGSEVVVGAAAVNASGRVLTEVPKAVLESIGNALYEAGDANEYVLPDAHL